VILEALAKLGRVVPSAPRPKQTVPLGRKLLFTALVAVAYVLLASVPIYGIERGATVSPFGEIVTIVLGMRQGTLAQLGIGPIVTAGLVLQILVGARLIELDLTKHEDRDKFTYAVKGLAVILAFVEAASFTFSQMFWPARTPSILSPIRFAVLAQLVWGALLIIMMDEAVQKGWGLGSGVSLFILIGVAQRIIGDLFTPFTVSAQTLGVPSEIFGLIPYIVDSVLKGRFDLVYVLVGRGLYGYPTLLSLIATLILLVILTYLQSMRINIPVTSPQLRGIRARIPLQLLYVTNIPVLLTGILFSNIILFANIARQFNAINYETYTNIQRVLSAPSIYTIAALPLHSLIYIVLFISLSIMFGLLWVEIGGLDPDTQAENLVKSGFEIPGMRRNPRVLSSYLAKYIYPLTVFSSIVVALIALVGDLLRVYGSGVGLLLSVGIVQNYYQALVYERTLEMYPAIKRLIGE